MSKPKLNIVCHLSDRTRALHDGTIPVEGIDANFIDMHVAEIFFRMVKHREFDASEMSLAAHTTLIGRGDSPFVGVPVFPSRIVRHSAMFIGAEKGIEKPEDLKGKLVGVPEYQVTAALVARGLLSDEYGVQPPDIRWRTECTPPGPFS